MATEHCKVVLVAAALLLGLLAHHSVFAGEMPMTESPVELVNSPAVQPRERAERIKELAAVAVSADRESVPKIGVAARDAIQRLVNEETLALLVEQIGYPDVSPPGIDKPRARGGFSQLGPVAARLPAVAALIEIGEPCVDRVIDKLLTTANDTEFKACIAVLQGIDKPAVKDKLDRAMKDVPATLRTRVTQAIEDKQSIEWYYDKIQRSSRIAFPQHWSSE
jgi:hypothetical protein